MPFSYHIPFIFLLNDTKKKGCLMKKKKEKRVPYEAGSSAIGF